MGLVNTVVPLERLEEETVQWCREMLALSPFALRLREGELPRRTRTASRASSSSRTTPTSCSTRSEEAQEGRDAYKEKRTPDFSAFPRRP